MTLVFPRNLPAEASNITPTSFDKQEIVYSTSYKTSIAVARCSRRTLRKAPSQLLGGAIEDCEKIWFPYDYGKGSPSCPSSPRKSKPFRRKSVELPPLPQKSFHQSHPGNLASDFQIAARELQSPFLNVYTNGLKSRSHPAALQFCRIPAYLKTDLLLGNPGRPLEAPSSGSPTSLDRLLKESAKLLQGVSDPASQLPYVFESFTLPPPIATSPVKSHVHSKEQKIQERLIIPKKLEESAPKDHLIAKVAAPGTQTSLTRPSCSQTHHTSVIAAIGNALQSDRLPLIPPTRNSAQTEQRVQCTTSDISPCISPKTFPISKASGPFSRRRNALPPARAEGRRSEELESLETDPKGQRSSFEEFLVDVQQGPTSVEAEEGAGCKSGGGLCPAAMGAGLQSSISMHPLIKRQCPLGSKSDIRLQPRHMNSLPWQMQQGDCDILGPWDSPSSHGDLGPWDSPTIQGGDLEF